MKMFNNRLMIVIGLSFIIYHLSFSPVGAQTFTQRLQNSAKGEATVTVHHDEAIDLLVNGTQTVSSSQTAKSTSDAKKVVSPKKTETSPAKEETTTTSTHIADTTSTAQKSGNTYKTTGYRIQVYAGGNSRKHRKQAEEIGNQLRMLFPMESVYVHFYSPRWICRMGNYRTYEEASQLLHEVKKLGYSAATIVKGKITVSY